MTTDQPIRFRNYADEDDGAWAGGAGREHRELPVSGDGVAAVPARGSSGRLLAVGAGLALIAGVAVAVSILPRHARTEQAAPSPGAALQVHRYVAPPKPFAATRALPCYVDGVAAGPLSLTDCARRNGVASGRLDVGLAAAPDSSAVPPSRQVAAVQAARPAPSLAPREAARWSFDPGYRSSDAYAENTDQRGPGAEDSVRAAQTFYEGLADADGDRAASAVIPEKRRLGPLSAGAIDRFYADLRSPLRLRRLDPVDDHTVIAHYDFVDRDGGVCRGTSRVTTTERDGEVYIKSVRALNGC